MSLVFALAIVFVSTLLGGGVEGSFYAENFIYMLENNHVISIPISSLRPGDKILVGPNKNQESCSYSPVLLVDHSPILSSSRYLAFKTSSSLRPLRLTPDHVACVVSRDICNTSFNKSWSSLENHLVCHSANMIRLGDCLVNSRFQLETISSIVCGEERDTTLHRFMTDDPFENLVVNDYIVARFDFPPFIKKSWIYDIPILNRIGHLNYLFEWLRKSEEKR